jgi:hypothetical protein
MNEQAREQVPAKTTPTWEMELLVSGATIFGLLQLPRLLDRGYYTALNLSPAEYEGLLFPLWLYSKVAVITLVLTFLLHLFLRGYWVALVGMSSVYPGGIRWEKLRMSPIALARNLREFGSMPEAIERADNRATRVFGTGFGFAMVMAIFAGLVALTLVGGVLVDAALGAGHLGYVLGAVIALFVLPWMLATTIDRAKGAELAPDSWLARALGAVFSTYARAGMGRRSNTLISLFASNEGRLRAVATAMLLVLPVVLGLMVQSTLARGRLPLGLFVGLSTEDAFSGSTSAAAFYDTPGMDRTVFLPMPHIPSRVATGEYLELFVPFIPRLHGPALERACPAATPAGKIQARLQCLARLSDIRIDGVRLDVQFDATSDAATGQPGMLAMLPVGKLPPGRHELSLNSPGRDGGDPARPQRRFRIPFWK